jgi:hypothetical protein
MVKEEEDIIGYTLPRMAAQLDHVIVADNLSQDRTLRILCETAEAYRNITVIDDPEPAYLQSEKTTKLASMARNMGATWVVPFDADEVWVAAASLRDRLPEFGAGGNILVEATLYDHVVTGTDDAAEPDPVKRIAHRRSYAGALPKVAAQTKSGLVIEQGNHSARYPGRVHRCGSEIVVHHYPYRSVEQMARKAKNGAAAYAAAGSRLPESAGAHWRDYGRFLENDGIGAIEEIFTTWFYVADPATDDQLVYDPCPI